ncbi:hypothetical protein O7635_31670 [Asanoa sp. WMMD1127]|uniref:hypothetical protein n=1 Tax=Asanoa sp. WMMD1127 TaxID=3016107 RepID=UPI002415D52B|nr:hypothetical protein [Asanoa sp. WMMD1127]MDG4826432.1 hypothetical protein [Asanoa sp. WMMD1127]
MTMIMADPAPVERPPRPGSVTVAFWLQLAAAAVLLAVVGSVVVSAVQFDGLVDRAVAAVPDADPAEVSAERTTNLVMSAIMGSLFLLMAAWLLATAAPLRRGSNVARILVFIGAGAHLVLCLAPCVGGVAFLPFFFLPEGPADGPPTEGFPTDWSESRFIETLYSDGAAYQDLLFGSVAVASMIEAVLVIAVVVLVVVPPAHRYFVPRPPTPPWPGPAYAMPYPTYVICPDPAAHAPKTEAGG